MLFQWTGSDIDPLTFLSLRLECDTNLRTTRRWEHRVFTKGAPWKTHDWQKRWKSNIM